MQHADRVNTPYARRTNYNTSGDDIRVGVNQFRIQSVAGRDVYQYDVCTQPGIRRVFSKQAAHSRTG
jgi:eukaryotic translation initiation factor 2C